MNRKQLDAFLARYGFKIDGGHFPHGESSRNRFCDLYIGTGAAYSDLDVLCRLLNSEGVTAKIDHVTNPDHEQHGQYMITIPSFWNA